MTGAISLRILQGPKVLQATPPAVGLAVVHEAPTVRVETMGNWRKIDHGAGRISFLFGRILGQRSAGGLLTSSHVSMLPGIDDNSEKTAVWRDAQEGRFVLVTVEADGTCRTISDRFGKVDLFLQSTSGGCSVATDLSLLAEAPGKSGYDQAALAHTLTYYGHRPPKRHTIYSGVSRLGIGEVAVQSGGKLNTKKLAFKPVSQRAYGRDQHEQYADLFLDFLRAAGSPEGNIVYLSSGWDSTSILAGLVHIFGASKVRAVIGRMHYSKRSGICNKFEIDRATKMAEFYGVKLDFAEFNYAESGTSPIDRARPIFKNYMYQSLTGLNHLLLSERVAELARGGEAIFAGEISDGAHNLGFSQYATLFHPSYDFREYADKMNSYLFGPTFLREVLAGRHEQDVVWRFFRDRAGDVKFDPPPSGKAALTQQMFVDFFLRNGRKPFWSLSNTALLTQAGANLYTDSMRGAYLDETSSAEPDELYSWYLHLYNSFHWQGSTVATLQTTAASNGLEAHLPYWSGALQDFLSAMPENWGRGLDFNPTKHPLKWMLRNRVKYPYDYQIGPHSYTYDVDPTFNHGEEVMCHSSLTSAAQTLLAERGYRNILSNEVFDLAYIDGIVDDYVAGRGPKGGRLGDLISVYLLCQSGWHA